MRAGFDVEHADVVIGLPSCQLDAGTQRHRDVVFVGSALDEPNPASEERSDVGRVDETSDVEDPGAFEKECALLGKEQRKPREIDLTDVGFRFGEVGVDSDCGIQVRREVLEDVEAARQLTTSVSVATRHIWSDVQPEALPNPLEAFETAGLREVPDPDVLARRRPAIGFLAALDLPFDIESPYGLARLEAERLEWDLDFGSPSLV